jgi:hypothetical protein
MSRVRGSSAATWGKYKISATRGSLDHDLGIQTHPPGSPETQFTAEYNGGGHQNMYQGDL